VQGEELRVRDRVGAFGARLEIGTGDPRRQAADNDERRQGTGGRPDQDGGRPLLGDGRRGVPGVRRGGRGGLHRSPLRARWAAGEGGPPRVGRATVACPGMTFSPRWLTARVSMSTTASPSVWIRLAVAVRDSSMTSDR